VTQYQPITSKDILDWVIEPMDGINMKLGWMDTLIQEASEKHFELQTVLPGLAKA
jgi:hypothetical protein